MPSLGAGGSGGTIFCGVGGPRHASRRADVPSTTPPSLAPARIQRRTASSSSGVTGGSPTGMGAPRTSSTPEVPARSFSQRRLAFSSPGSTSLIAGSRVERAWTRLCHATPGVRLSPPCGVRPPWQAALVQPCPSKTTAWIAAQVLSEDCPTQVSRQLLVQLSVSTVFPSSQSSPGSRTPSPQRGSRQALQPSPSTALPSSHSSPGSTIPSPQRGGTVKTRWQSALQVSPSGGSHRSPAPASTTPSPQREGAAEKRFRILAVRALSSPRRRPQSALIVAV